VGVGVGSTETESGLLHEEDQREGGCLATISSTLPLLFRSYELRDEPEYGISPIKRQTGKVKSDESSRIMNPEYTFDQNGGESEDEEVDKLEGDSDGDVSPLRSPETDDGPNLSAWVSCAWAFSSS
jgi:hypothetical protein